MKLLPLLFPVAASAAPPTPPTPPAPPVPVETAPSNSRSVFKSGTSEIEIQTTGKVTFAPDSEAIFDLHGDGTLRVQERNGKDTRLLTVKRSEVVWRVNGTARAFDAQGKTWLRRILKARPAVPTPPTPPTPSK
jgi:hypothetical protein